MIEITDWEIPELKWFQNRNETQLLHYFEPEPGIFIAESPKTVKIECVYAYQRQLMM